MKKKSLIKSCLLGAALLLGTGYAVINSKEVNITGTVGASNYEMDVRVFLQDQSDSFVITNNGCNNNVCNFSFVLNEDSALENVGDMNSVEVYVQSDEYNVDVKVSVPVINNDSEFFDVRWAGWEEEQIMSTTKEQVEITSPGVELYALIDVFLVKMPITEEESTATFTIEFNLTPVRKS
jgi:hypothetical protein